MVWSVKDAPVSDVQERVVLTIMAEEAGEDGTGTFLSVPHIAERARLSDREVRRCIADMLERKLIQLGDQSLARYIRRDQRPKVYDLMIPYSWFGNVDRVNAWRRRTRNLPPLSPDDRPEIAPPPPKKQRADAGKKRMRGKAAIEDMAHLADGVTSSPVVDGVTASHAVDASVTTDGHHRVTGSDHGVTSKSPRGDYQSPDPVVTNPSTSPPTPPPPLGGNSPGGPTAEGEGESAMTEEGDDLDSVVSDVVSRRNAMATRLGRRPDWLARSVRSALQSAIADGRSLEDAAEALRAVADDEGTQSPRRILADGWWSSWAASRRKPAAVPDESTPEPRRGSCPEPRCDSRAGGIGWILDETLDRPAAPCPTCRPGKARRWRAGQLAVTAAN